MLKNSKKTKTLALFDFDGTLTKRDSMFDFFHHAVGTKSYLLGIALNIPNFILLALRLRRNEDAKQRFFSSFFAGWKIDSLLHAGKTYPANKIIRQKGITRIKQHITSGHRVIIVSASLEIWLKPWCQETGIELLATRAEHKNGFITGKFFGKNCYGKEKVERLNQHLKLDHYDEIYAYGDSSGDTEMLELAQFRHYKPFR